MGRTVGDVFERDGRAQEEAPSAPEPIVPSRVRRCPNSQRSSWRRTRSQRRGHRRYRWGTAAAAKGWWRPACWHHPNKARRPRPRIRALARNRPGLRATALRRRVANTPAPKNLRRRRPAAGRKASLHVVNILQCHAQLPQVVGATAAATRLACRLNRRQQNGNEHANDRDDDQQLHEREAGSTHTRRFLDAAHRSASPVEAPGVGRQGVDGPIRRKSESYCRCREGGRQRGWSAPFIRQSRADLGRQRPPSWLGTIGGYETSTMVASAVPADVYGSDLVGRPTDGGLDTSRMCVYGQSNRSNQRPNRSQSGTTASWPLVPMTKSLAGEAKRLGSSTHKAARCCRVSTTRTYTFSGVASNSTTFNMKELPTPAGVCRGIAAHARTLPAGEWVTGGSWDDQRGRRQSCPTSN